MGWDNRILNVNGRGLRMLESAIALACDDGQWKNLGGGIIDPSPTKIVGSLINPESGLIWLWTKCDGASMYPAELTPRQAAEITLQWLESDGAKHMQCDGCDANADHDGHNSRGWRTYVGDWGHVGKASWAAICAVRPVYLWHGK